MSDINTKVSVSGAQEYKAKMGELKSSAKALDAEMQRLTSGFDENTTAAEKTAAKQELLGRQIDNQQAIVNALADRYNEMTAELDKLQQAADDAAKANGSESTEAKKAALEVTRFKTATNDAAAELDRAKAKLNNMQNGLRSVGEEAQQTSPKVSAFGDVLKANLAADAIKAGLSGLVSMIKDMAKWMSSLVSDSAAYADEIRTLSVTTGMSTDALQEYKYMAELTDVSIETITGAQTKLEKAMSSAANGGKSAASVFSKLGVAYKNSDGSLRDMQAVFPEALQSLSSISNETEQDTLAMELFGKSAKDLKPLMDIGAEGLAAFRQEAHDAGYVLDKDQLEKLGKVDDAYQRFDKRLDGLKRTFASNLAPAVETVFAAASKIIDNIDWDNFNATVESISNDFADWAGSLSAEDISDGLQTAVDLAASLVSSLESIAYFLDMLSGRENPDIFGVQGAIDGDKVKAKVEAANEAIAKNKELLNDTSVPYLARMDAYVEPVGELGTAMDAVWSSLRDDSGPAATEAENAMDKAGSSIEDLGKKAEIWGSDLITNYAKGIEKSLPKLQEAVDETAETVKGPLHFSRPDYGPLREYESWMPDFMSGLAATMEANVWRVQEASTAAANAIYSGIALKSQQNSAQQQSAAGFSALADAIAGMDFSPHVDVTLQGSAKEMFRVVRAENNRIANATGYNKLGRSRT